MHHQTDSEPRLKNDSITWDGSAGRVTDTLQRSFNKIEDNFDLLYANILPRYHFEGVNNYEHMKLLYKIVLLNLETYSQKVRCH